MNFAAWLYRPYLDLTPPQNDAPLHTFGVEFDYLNMTQQANLPRIQSVLMPSFRAELILEARDFRYALDCPLALHSTLITDRWHFLCEKIRNFSTLDKEEQSKVLWLMNKLCFYQKTKEFETSINPAASVQDAELAYIYALSHYTLSLEKKSGYSLSEFEKIAVQAPKNSLSKVNASYQMVVQNVKHCYDVNKVEEWLPKHYSDIQNIEPYIDDFSYVKLLTRYYRVAGFLPQMKKKYDDMTGIMDLAEKYAYELFEIAHKITENQQFYLIAAKEMLYPVIESRTKEALILEDYALAEQRAKFLVLNNPNEPRARLHLGQVLIENGKVEEALNEYLAATELAPPGQEIAWFMIGQCYDALGNNQAAMSAYKRSLYYDPQGVSAFERLKEQNNTNFKKSTGFSLVEPWVINSLLQLKQFSNTKTQNSNVQPYQKRQFNEVADIK